MAVLPIRGSSVFLWLALTASISLAGCNSKRNDLTPASTSGADSQNAGGAETRTASAEKETASAPSHNPTVAFVHELASDSVASVYGSVPERHSRAPGHEPRSTGPITSPSVDTPTTQPPLGTNPAAGSSSGNATTPPMPTVESSTTTTAPPLQPAGAATGANNPGAARDENVSEIIVRLTNAIALEQTTVEGTLMSFSVDYFQIGGTPKTGARYYWVITRADGQAFTMPIESLADRGTLAVFVGWRKNNGPFNSQFMAIWPDKSRHLMCDPVTHY